MMTGRRGYALVFGLLLVTAVAVELLSLRSRYRATLAHWEARQSSIADDRARMVSDWLKERQADTEALASRVSVVVALRARPGGPPTTSKLTRELTLSLDGFAHAYEYPGVYVLDLQGRVVGRSSRAPELDAQATEACRITARSGEPQSELLGDVPDRRRFFFTYPVSAKEAIASPMPRAPHILGVVAILANPARTLFPQLMTETVPTRTGEVMLVRRAGSEVEYIAPLRHIAIGATGLRRPYHEALASAAAFDGREAFGEFRDYRGVSVLAATRRIPATGWGLVCKVDRDEALGDFYRMAWVEGLTALLVIAALGGLLVAHQRYAAALASKGEQERFRALVQASAQVVWTTNPQGEVEDMPAWRAFTGQTVEEVRGWGWATALHPDDREPTTAIWREALEARSLYDTEYRIRRKDGEYRYFSARGVPVLEPDGGIREWVGFCADIHDRKMAEQELRRLNRALRTLSECNQAMVRAREESELLASVCRILVDDGGYRLAWVGYVEHDEEKSVRPMGWAGHEDGYLALVNASWADNDRGQGPTGTAIRSGQTQVARNLREDPQFAPWREEAIRRGYASSIALPLVQNGQPFGALMLYSPTVNAFDDEEVRLLTELARDLEYGIQALRTRAERARAQDELQRANAYNRSLIEASLDPLVTISPEGKITDVNSGTERATGCSRTELIGTDFSNYFTHPTRARAGYEQVFREGSVEDYELDIRHRDGHTTPVLYNATVYRDDAGEVMGVFAAARDIAERKRVEEELRLSRERLVLAFRAGQSGSFEWDIQKNANVWSPEIEELYGVAPGEFGGTFEAWEKLVLPEDMEAARRMAVAALQSGELIGEWRVRRASDGEIRWLTARGKVFFDGAGRPTRMIGINVDITDRKRAEEALRKLNETLEKRVRERTAELEATNKDLEAFTYSVSHDLRSPLRHVDGFSRLLVEDFGAQLPPEARHYLERIQSGTRQMGQLVDDLLNLSRIGRQELRLQITGLGSLADEVIGELKNENRGRQIEWKVASLPFVECDPSLMKQVFANLLSNAVKFTRPRKSAVIEVGAERGEGSPVVFVRDNGVGFSMKYADKLFGVFQRLHRPEEFEGTGVGLATVQRIITKHHGRVWAEAGLDQGATFYFSLEEAGQTRPRAGKLQEEHHA
ncbi:MAG: PAS domain S-box protein [Terriglobia bacterium]